MSNFIPTFISKNKSKFIWHGKSKELPGYMWSLDHDFDTIDFSTGGRRPTLTKIIRPDRPQPDARTMVVHGD